MKKLSLSLAGLLLATSALTLPGVAAAQDEISEVEEVVIVGENIPQPMRETSEVASFLQAEDLQRQGDDNAAVALTRVTGLSLISGRFVYVRGLGERYSSALLNGSPLPSPEPLQRVIPLDLFPANILAGTIVQKTYSPRYPGEFGGGVIDLQTVTAPNEPFFTIGASIGGNTETTLQSGLVYFGSETDWTGFDDGTRNIPEQVRAAIATGNRISDGDFTPEELQFIGHSFVNAPLNLLQRESAIQPNFSIDVSGGASFDTSWGLIGVIGVVGFDSDWRTRNGVQQEGAVVGADVVVVNDYAFQSTQNDITLNGLLGVGVLFGDHELRWTNLYIRSVQKETRVREGYNQDRDAIIRTDYTEWFERELLDTQLAGEHQWGDLEVDWRGSWAQSTREAPYERSIEYAIVDGFYEHDASREQNATRFSFVEDTVASAGIDLTYTFHLSSQREAILGGGYAFLDNERTSEAREFKFLALVSSLPQAVRRERVDFLLADFNIRPDLLVLRETTGSQGAAAYDAGLRVHAGYVQIDAEIIPRVRVAAGVRFEDAVQSVQPRDLFGGAAPFAPQPLENSYWLLAATLTWNIYEDMQLRFGVSQTIARPQFRELAPQLYTDPESDRKFIGNPFLVDSELLNFDVRYEWYFARNQFFTVGAFYKNIDRPVESVVFSPDTQTFLNAPSATLYGAEVEVRLNIDPIMDEGWLSTMRWFFQANYTYTTSEVRVGANDVVLPLETGGVPVPANLYLQDGVRLQGQSDHLANVQFGFEDEEHGAQATLLLTYASERITARNRPGQPDFVQEPGFMLDLTVRKTITVAGRDFRLGFEARNLLGTEFQEYQEFGAGRVDVNRYDLGRSFSFSLSTTF